LVLTALVTVTACQKAPQAHPGSAPIADQGENRSAESERAKFQGRWKQLSVELDGKQIAPELIRNCFLVYEGENFRNDLNGQSKANGSFMLDPTKTPARIDHVESPTVTLYGIYRFDGDTLTLCFNGRYRPSSFESQARSGNLLLVLDRDPAR
jgi:uncharacterized protein (TIGR03067 family)